MGGGGGGFRSAFNGTAAAKQRAAEEQARQAANAKYETDKTAAASKGVRLSRQMDQERRAGVDAPSYEGTRDYNTGKLLDQYKFDPYKGEATQALKQQAFAQGNSPWAQAELASARQEQMQGMDAASKQGLQSMNQGQSALAMSGGLSSGARERMARGGARDLMAARQSVAQQGLGTRLSIGQNDQARKADLLGKFTDAERGAQQSDLNMLTGDLQGQAAFDANRYGQQMQAWSAAQNASAQRDAANSRGGGGGCCFIFLEARYGNGVMDSVVRRYRDEFMTVENKRGYYKLAEVLVPLMRKSKTVKFLVRALMTDPLVSYGKWYYGHNMHGFIFAPFKSFWLGMFSLLGGHTEFVRETGETV